MEIENIILSSSITIIALGMLIVSLLSYRKSKNVKLLFVSSAFIIFFIKGVIQSLSLFCQEIAMLDSNVYMKSLDLIILIFLFVATLKR